MCTGAEVGLIISAVGAGASAINTQQSLKRQDRQAAAGILRQSREQEAADRRVREHVAGLEQSTDVAERGAALADFQQALRQGRDATETGLTGTQVGGERFVERAGQAAERLKTGGQAMAERLAIIDGVLRQRTREGLETGRVGVDLTGIGGNIDMEDYLMRLRMAGERPNPWVDLAAGLAQSVGGGMATRTPKTSESPPAASPPAKPFPFGVP